MTKIMVPRANEQEKAAFEKFKIKLIDSIDEKDFEEVIIEYLNQHNVLHLATCKDNEPRSTPLEYFNNDLTVYIFSEGGGKFANLKVNPRVSYSISDPYEPAEDFFGASGLQVWGTASTFKKNDNLKKYEEINKHSRNTCRTDPTACLPHLLDARYPVCPHSSQVWILPKFAGVRRVLDGPSLFLESLTVRARIWAKRGSEE